MSKDFSNEFRKTYKRNGRDCYFDPIRKRLIYVTPEETVRQEVIRWLIEELNVPIEAMCSEMHLSAYAQNSKKRADIIIHKQDKEDCSIWHPIAVIECKAPHVNIDSAAEAQAIGYCDMIHAEYAMVTNGIEKLCLHYDSSTNCYGTITELPVFDQMCSGEYSILDIGELPSRIPFDKIEKYLREDFAARDEEDVYEYYEDISKQTPMKYAVPAFNFLECLLDTRVKMPVGDYGSFTLIEDCGVRMLTYGNAGGGAFFGPYRSFLVSVNGSTEIYSITVTTYSRTEAPGKVKTCICVAHDDDKSQHHSLQLVLESNVEIDGRNIDFYHNGRIAVGNIGSGKISDLRELVLNKRPSLISGNRFYLGRLVNDRLWTLADPEVINFVVNLISYAMIRDEYRETVKAEKCADERK